jgi:predicted DNA-binding transcriptional regulator AlpA
MDDLLNRSEIAEFFGVGPAAVGNWQHRGRRGWAVRFPEPVNPGGGGRRHLWRRGDIEAWAFATGRLPLAAALLSDLLE